LLLLLPEEKTGGEKPEEKTHSGGEKPEEKNARRSNPFKR
jgi:hypothetical protein